MDAKDSFITKDFAKTIVPICFNIKEIKDLYDSGSPTSAKNIFNCHEELKEKTDALITSSSERVFITNIESVRKSIQNMLNVYENIQIAFDHKEQLTDLLRLLDKNLATLYSSSKHK